MSMSQHPVSPDQRIRNAFMLANYVQARREALHLMIAQAAALAGIEISQWCSIEAGWVPGDDDPALCSIAETLQVGYMNLSFIAAVSRVNQEDLSL